jgi:hypothetical protein
VSGVSSMLGFLQRRKGGCEQVALMETWRRWFTHLTACTADRKRRELTNALRTGRTNLSNRSAGALPDCTVWCVSRRLVVMQ